MDAIELQDVSRSFAIDGAPLHVLDRLDLRVAEREAPVPETVSARNGGGSNGGGAAQGTPIFLRRRWLATDGGA